MSSLAVCATPSIGRDDIRLPAALSDELRIKIMEAARVLYNVLGYAALPFLPARLWLRGRREPGYRSRIGERFGRYTTAAVGAPLVWLHAVSVGETRAALPLVQRLSASYPAATILLTHMTATGRETGRALFGERVTQAWLPYDLPFAVDGFLSHFQPAVGFLLETELWPNLIAKAIPSLFCPRDEGSRGAVAIMVALMLIAIIGFASLGTEIVLLLSMSRHMQSAADAGRLASLGAAEPVVTGNLKFDVRVPDATLSLASEFKHRFGSRPLWVAASTREGEEALIVDALARFSMPKNSLLIIVPRHPQRFEAVADLLRARGIPFARRTENRAVTADLRVVLGDSMGEMLAYYAASDLAFVGGSLLPLGGQNMIEPLAVGTPVVIGPHTFNFSDAAQGAVSAGAARRVGNADELLAEVARLLSNPIELATMRDRARSFHAAHRGAADRLWRWLEPRLAATLGAPILPDRG